MNQPFWKSKLRAFVDIKRDELGQAFLMFVYNFLVIASHTIVKSIRDALFLNTIGAKQLPYVYIGIALIAGVVTPVYFRIARITGRRGLIIGSNLFFVSNILAFWWLFRYEWPWLSYMLYIWASIFVAVLSLQFVLVAYDIFNIQQAKRMFSFFFSGGTLGAIIGGMVSRSAVNIIGTENLFFIVAAILLACVPIIRLVTRQKTQDTSKTTSTRRANKNIGGAFTFIQQNRHLTLLTIIIGVMVLATTLIDFQFKNIVQQTYEEKAALARFFGSYYVYSNIVTLLLQLLVTVPVLKRFGVGVAILIMPFGFFLGSFAILFYPMLWAAVFIKVCEDSFTFSVNKAGIEVLYIPVPSAIKDKAKAFIDIIVERASRGIAGLLLLLLTTVLSLSVSQLSIFVLIFLGIWIFVGIRIKREYVSSLEATLKKQSLNVDALTVDLDSSTLDSSTVNQLLQILNSSNERQILYALELLQDVESSQLQERLHPLLQHPSRDVKVRTLRMLFDIGARNLTPQIKALLEDDDEDVRAEAIHYICVYGEDSPVWEQGRVPTLRSFLAHSDYRVKGAAITCIINHGGDEERALLARDLIEQMLQETGTHRTLARLEAAKALKVLSASSPMQNYLLDLLNDDTVEIVNEAIVSAAQIRHTDFVPPLIEKLGDSTTRVLARDTLASYGTTVLESLVSAMTDEQKPMSLRSHIPRVCGLIKHQDSVGVLLDNLKQDEIELRYKIIKALGKLRASQAEVQFDEEKVEAHLEAEFKNYYHLLGMLDAQNENSSSFLNRALQERLEQLKEMIFRLLELVYPPDSMSDAYRGVTSPNERIRANALEVLDNSPLKRNVKRMLFPIIEENPREAEVQRALALLDLHPITKQEGITALITGKDIWLKACALYTVGEEGMSELAEYIEAELANSHPLIRESAEFTWRKLMHT